jgi:Holliday junction resolvasome RuvABC endonuclease subunit
MHRKTTKIIGLNPGTRYMGIAVFYGSELRDWQVRNMDGRWSSDKMARVIMLLSSLIDCHKPDVLAIKRLHPSRSSPNLNKLVGRINELSKRKGLMVCQYTIDELKRHLQSENRMAKRDIAEIVVKEYPILSHELRKEHANMNPYYIRMFEAVAIGSVCFHQLDRGRRTKAV